MMTMNISKIQPIPNEPAVVITAHHQLVIADLHIGIERELREHGLHIPSQTSTMIHRVVSLIKTYAIQSLIIVGDIKHNIPTSTMQERRDVQHFLGHISNHCTIHVLPGNHDGNLSKMITDDIMLHDSAGAVIGEIGFVHGHRWPNADVMECQSVFIAHTHPTIQLTDRLGYKTYEPCWLRCSGNTEIREKYPKISEIEFIMLPAFNPLCGGIAVNTEPILGPFEKILDIQQANVYLLDGSALGQVQDIK